MITREAALTTSFDDIASGPALPPLIPGEVLLEEFMRPLGLTANELGAEIGVPGNRISTIINGSRSITAETAILLGRRFGTSPELWMNLQAAHDLASARGEGRVNMDRMKIVWRDKLNSLEQQERMLVSGQMGTGKTRLRSTTSESLAQVQRHIADLRAMLDGRSPVSS